MPRWVIGNRKISNVYWNSSTKDWELDDDDYDIFSDEEKNRVELPPHGKWKIAPFSKQNSDSGENHAVGEAIPISQAFQSVLDLAWLMISDDGKAEAGTEGEQAAIEQVKAYARKQGMDVT